MGPSAIDVDSSNSANISKETNLKEMLRGNHNKLSTYCEVKNLQHNSAMESVTLYGHCLKYKKYGQIVLFKTTCVLKMLTRVFSLASKRRKTTLRSLLQNPQMGQHPFLLEESWKQAFISWNALKLIVDGNLLDATIRKTLLDFGTKNSRKKTMLKHDCIKLGNISIPFKIKAGNIFLELENSCLSLGIQEETMTYSHIKTVMNHQEHENRHQSHYKLGANNKKYISMASFLTFCGKNEMRKRVVQLEKQVERAKLKIKAMRREFETKVQNIIGTNQFLKDRIKGHENVDGDKCVNISQDLRWHTCEKLKTINLDNVQVPYVMRKKRVFLELAAAKKLLGKLYSKKMLSYKNLDKILISHGYSKDDTFLFKIKDKSCAKKYRTHISLKAYRILTDQKKPASRKTENLNFANNIPSIKSEPVDNEFSLNQSIPTKKKIKLKLDTCGQIDCRIKNGTLYLHTGQMLKASGFSKAHSNQSVSKNTVKLCQILGHRGLKISPCFLKRGRRKYHFISLYAIMTALKSEIGFLKQTNQVKLIHHELNAALRTFQNGTFHRNAFFSKIITGDSEHQYINIGSPFPLIYFKIKEGAIFLEKYSCFKCVGLQDSVGRRNEMKIESILQGIGESLQDAFLPYASDKFAFISIPALVNLLEYKHPQIICLPKKEQFRNNLFLCLQKAGEYRVSNISLEKIEQIPYYCLNGRIYLHRHNCYSMAGLYDQVSNNGEYDIYEDPVSPLIDRGLDPAACFKSEDGDQFSYISIEALFVILRIELESRRAEDHKNIASRDLLSAIAIQVPRLRTQIKTVVFRKRLIDWLQKCFISIVQDFNNSPTSDHISCSSKEDLPSLHEEHAESPESFASIHNQPGPSLSTETFEITPLSDSGEDYILSWDLYTSIRHDIANALCGSGSDTDSVCDEERDDLTSGSIGDWDVMCLESKMHLSVAPGHRASRKISFLSPDVAAILRFDLELEPEKTPILSINKRQIPFSDIASIFSAGLKEGVLSLLYRLISIRPCFGSFNPELVETVSQGLLDCDNSDLSTSVCSKVYIDGTFMISSSSGRYYAGTVRSRDCAIIAMSRVTDHCTACKSLDQLTVNRSLLTEEAVKQEKIHQSSLNMLPVQSLAQRSVWQLVSSSEEGCQFICPQLQSFNTSLPHAFVGSAQATAIVNHEVFISSQLEVEVMLGGYKVADGVVRECHASFWTDRQVGPLLEWVAGLRACIGYPEPDLVNQVKFLMENIQSLNPEIRAYFTDMKVDALNFSTGGVECCGTIRSVNCSVVSHQGADICDQCRRFQNPLEFV